MTREEAIKHLQNILKYVAGLDGNRVTAIDMAIEALQQLTSYEETIVKLTTAIGEKGDDEDDEKGDTE